MAIKGRLGVNGKMNMDVRRKLALRAHRQNMNSAPDARTKLLYKRLSTENVVNMGSKINNISLNDVRFKLIEKERSKITDARDKLAEISKKTDARVKLQALRKMQSSSTTVSIKKTISNGGVNKDVKIIADQEPIPEVTKTTMKRGALTRTVTGTTTGRPAITKIASVMQKAPALKRTIPGATKKFVAKKPTNQLSSTENGRSHPLKNNPNVVTIKNDRATGRKSFQSKPTQKRIHPWIDDHFRPGSTLRMQQGSFQQNPSSQLYETSPVYQNLPFQMASPRMQSSHAFASGMVPSVFQQVQDPFLIRQPSRHADYGGFLEPRGQMFSDPRDFGAEENHPTRLRITAFNNWMGPNAQFEDNYGSSLGSSSKMNALKRPILDDHEEYRPSPKRNAGNLAKSNFRSGDEGHKIMVTNLHSIVTVDDIRELFGCIGPIYYARMIREGIAEISFVNEEDALRSVDVYHNRQLDQQPMSVVLISKKSGNPAEYSTKKFSSFNPELEERNARAQQRRSATGFTSDRSADSFRLNQRSGYDSTAGHSSARSVPRSAGFDSLFRSDSRSTGNLNDSFNRGNSSFLKSARGSSNMFIF